MSDDQVMTKILANCTIHEMEDDSFAVVLVFENLPDRATCETISTKLAGLSESVIRESVQENYPDSQILASKMTFTGQDNGPLN